MDSTQINTTTLLIDDQNNDWGKPIHSPTGETRINDLPIEIYNKIAVYDHTIYRALLGIYAFGISTLVNQKNTSVFLGSK